MGGRVNFVNQKKSVTFAPAFLKKSIAGYRIFKEKQNNNNQQSV